MNADGERKGADISNRDEMAGGNGHWQLERIMRAKIGEDNVTERVGKIETTPEKKKCSNEKGEQARQSKHLTYES